ncbi:hypothetical protein GMO_27140 [Gluconobacter morbifer G707]|uniref:Uncharacterized protein n=1 Tax=Gluconobacter morbifer G707 TaxID=1088869 RepID=G6XMJ6_9PROT|nr:hypothetical protein GMO_27140 [Gluconobacter morbifer G707]
MMLNDAYLEEVAFFPVPGIFQRNDTPLIGQFRLFLRSCGVGRSTAADALLRIPPVRHNRRGWT